MTKLYTLLAAIAFIFTASAAQAGHDWSACKAEMEKFSCKGSDEEIWACLQKHDVDLSEKCDNEGHSKYEAATGKKK